MPRAYITRRVTFTASHRYGRGDWSDERNEKVFGRAARDPRHSHSYACEVTIAGKMDPNTGFVIDLGALDDLLMEEVKTRFDNRDINADVSEFSEGTLAPSGENIALFIFNRLRDRLPGSVHLESVMIAEDDTLSATYKGEA